MAIRVYTPQTDIRRRPKNHTPKPKPGEKKVFKSKNLMRRPGKKKRKLKYCCYTPVKASHIDSWQKVMPQLSRDLIEACIYRGREWMLYMMRDHFDDPKKIGDKFFTWASLLMKKIGREALNENLKKDMPLYQFLQGYQKSLNTVAKRNTVEKTVEGA